VSPRSSIFVIDDDPGMLRSIERLLKVYGFDVQTFTSAEEFLNDANARDAGCLVLDIHLGGMSGIDLGHKLALSGIAIPVIFITANDSDVVRKAAVEVGCRAYLPKPFSAKELMNAVGKALVGP
jgi:FixJ family two-component response regulator